MYRSAPASSSGRRATWLVGLLALALPLAAACGGGGGDGDTGIGVPAVEVRTSTAGTELDPDGYTVLVDGGDARPIGLTDTIFLDPLPAGAHTIGLEGIAGNCAVDGENPSVTVALEGATQLVEFAVVCGAVTGALVVTTATGGTALDPDGYEVQVDGGTPQPIGVDGSLTVSGLTPGSHSVNLGGVAGNCQVQGANPVQVEVLPETVAPVEFAVVCTDPPGAGRIAFTTNAVGLLGIIVVDPDGSDFTSLTPDGTFESGPVWSPDAQRLLFLDEAFDLGVMSADGSGRRRLVDGTEIAEYRWSPDGSRIAFVDNRFVGSDVISTLWVVAADGTGKRELARDATSPTWSPDSRRVAYVSSADQIHIRVIDVDAGGDRRLSPRAFDAFQPAWSPTAEEIAFVTLDDREIMLVPAEGGPPVNLTDGRGVDESPTWSPDGARIAFNTSPPDQPFESEVGLMGRDGGGRTLLTNRPGFDFGPDWSPDGARIVFIRSEERGQELDTEIYSINADGSGELNLSNRPASYETAPDWSGSGPGIVASRGRTVGERWMEMRAGRSHGRGMREP